MGRFGRACGGVSEAHPRLARSEDHIWEGGSVVTGESAGDLRLRLRRLGLSDDAISAAWPQWWSADAEASPSARAELRFGIARRLGLDPRSLLGEQDEPRFL